jgi:Lrp/AsnC family transcriptional regulator, leucine-responsive regulatory protein
LDKLDAGIVREMMRGNVRNLMLLNATELRKSFRSIARSLNVDQGTVRNRIRRLKESGLIRGWHLGINPRLFGQQLECLMFDVNPDYDKREVIKKISSIANVVLVTNYIGPPLHVLVSCDTEESLSRISKKIAELTGGGQPVWANRPTSTIHETLKKSDWQIIRSLQQDPWKSYDQIAKEVHLSSKTTRKRLAKLSEEGAIQLSVDVNLSALRGVVPAALLVFYSTLSERNQIIRRITEYVGDELFFAELADSQVGFFALSVPNAARLEDIGNWIRTQPGVKSCRTLIALDVIPVNVMDEKEMEQMVLEVAQPQK